MLLPLIPLILLGVLTLKVVLLRRRGRAFLALNPTERLRFAQLLIRDGSLPLVSRGLAAIAAGYLALPIDLIPDFIPVLGHADDFLVVTVLLGVILKNTPPERLSSLLRQSRDLGPEIPESRHSTAGGR
jgi:uncharacterized membrane protein YkvA (DUF1232 family)